MARSAFPDREEQANIYRKILEGFPEQTVNIRTLDIGGDKGLPYFSYPAEDNPFLGWRSIRVSLERQDIFKEQLAGILLASHAGNPTIMFPLISSLDEIRQIREILTLVRNELLREGHNVPGYIPFGIMVEIPAAVQIIEYLVREVDYVSIGTNDLIQYTLAVDRNNSRVRQYYDPHHPAILHSIKRVADAAAKAGKKASVCGEMAADPLNALLLAGMGIRLLNRLFAVTASKPAANCRAPFWPAAAVPKSAAACQMLAKSCPCKHRLYRSALQWIHGMIFN
jgi:phosphotransferase system enzyme I (PtsP)